MKEVLIAFILYCLLLPSVIAAPYQYAEKEARAGSNPTRICLDLMDLDFEGEDSDDQWELPPLDEAETSGQQSDAPFQLKKPPEPVVRESGSKGFDTISPLTPVEVSPLVRTRPVTEAEAETSVSSGTISSPLMSLSPPSKPYSGRRTTRFFEAEPNEGVSFSSPEIMPRGPRN